MVTSAICASRVKLQHLPSQEQWDRLLVLYPNSLAIFSEEADGLCFKGELPLGAIHINLEEKEKQIRSFLIEGRLINTIRVVCASYEDYSHWLLCLQTVCRRQGAPLLPGPESFPGLRVPAQALGSIRGSLSSDGRTSWDSGYPAPPSTRTSHSLPESSVPSTAGCPTQPAPLSRLGLEGGPEASDHTLETPHSPLYADPYTPPANSRHKITDIRGLDEFLSAVQSSRGPEPPGPFPPVPVSVPVSDPSSRPSGHHLPSRKGASQRPRGSAKGRGPRPPNSPQLVAPAREASSSPLPPPPDGGPPRSCDNIWDKAVSPPNQRRLRGATEAAAGLIQWI